MWQVVHDQGLCARTVWVFVLLARVSHKYCMPEKCFVLLLHPLLSICELSVVVRGAVAAEMRGSVLATITAWLAMSARLRCSLASVYTYVNMCVESLVHMCTVACSCKRAVQMAKVRAQQAYSPVIPWTSWSCLEAVQSCLAQT